MGSVNPRRGSMSRRRLDPLAQHTAGGPVPTPAGVSSLISGPMIDKPEPRA